jgi:hypothetical protein
MGRNDNRNQPAESGLRPAFATNDGFLPNIPKKLPEIRKGCWANSSLICMGELCPTGLSRELGETANFTG